MKHVKYLPVWIIAAVVTGCGVVYTTQPIGEKPSLIEAGAWEGN